MNREQRRGNRARVQVHNPSDLAGLTAENAARHAFRTGQYNQSTAGELPERFGDGRFKPREVRLAVELPSVPVLMTRQQRRANERLQAKIARYAVRAWHEVTGGDGVTLLHGQEVPHGHES